MTAFVSVTQVRIRSIRFVPGFAFYAIRSFRQAQRSPGFIGGEVLPDRRWTFWTMTAWDSRASMRDYMTAGSHRDAMPRLLNWGDEASVVNWEQDDDQLPTWRDVDWHMRVEGRPSKVRYPSLQHGTLAYREPRKWRGAPIRPERSSAPPRPSAG